MRMQKIIYISVIIVLLLFLCSCANENIQKEAPTPPASSGQDGKPAVSSDVPSSGSQDTAQNTNETAEPDSPVNVSGEVVISFNYERIPGSASNQYAVWIEDMDGNLIRTLFATRWTAEGGYQTRPDSIALWAERSGLPEMTREEVDAVSGATPRTGPQVHVWDLTDTNGEKVAPGEYRFFVEGTLRWKNYVLFTGVIKIGEEPVIVEATAKFVYEATDRYDALTSDSPENRMIGPVTASFTP